MNKIAWGWLIVLGVIACASYIMVPSLPAPAGSTQEQDSDITVQTSKARSESAGLATVVTLPMLETPDATATDVPLDRSDDRVLKAGHDGIPSWLTLSLNDDWQNRSRIDGQTFAFGTALGGIPGEQGAGWGLIEISFPRSAKAARPPIPAGASTVVPMSQPQGLPTPITVYEFTDGMGGVASTLVLRSSIVPDANLKVDVASIEVQALIQLHEDQLLAQRKETVLSAVRSISIVPNYIADEQWVASTVAWDSELSSTARIMLPEGWTVEGADSVLRLTNTASNLDEAIVITISPSTREFDEGDLGVALIERAFGCWKLDESEVQFEVACGSREYQQGFDVQVSAPTHEETTEAFWRQQQLVWSIMERSSLTSWNQGRTGGRVQPATPGP